MEKVTKINLSGIVFHINENAFLELKEYLDKVKDSIDVKIQDEVILDIENRIAELFLEIQKRKSILDIQHVKHIIGIMGNPEDYILEENEKKTDKEKEKIKKVLFRDPDNKILTGLSSGIAHYFSIDPIIIRAFWVLLVITYGSGVLFYFLLWLIIPQAETTSDKLKMKGEAPDIDSIKKTIQENKDKLKKGKDIIEGFLGGVLKIVMFIFKIIAFILCFALVISIILLILSYTLGLGYMGFLDEFCSAVFEYPKWIIQFSILIYISLGLMLILLCSKFIFKNVRRIYKALIGLFIVFFISVIACLLSMSNFLIDITDEIRIEENNETREFTVKSDTVNIKVDDYVSYMSYGFWKVNERKIINRRVVVDIIPIEGNTLRVMTQVKSNRKETLENIYLVKKEVDYRFNFNRETLHLRSYFDMPKKMKFRFERIKVNIYIPKDKILCVDDNFHTNLYHYYYYGLGRYYKHLKGNCYKYIRK